MLERKTPRFSHSQGAVLLVSLILLLAMTLIGVAAIDSSSLQSQMSNNSLSARNRFQASLSEIQGQFKKMLGIVYLSSIKTSLITIPDSNAGITTTGPGLTLSGSELITHDTSGVFTQSANVVFSGKDSVPKSGQSLSAFGVFSYEVNTITKVTGTNPTSNQTQGLQRTVPAGQD